MASWRLDAYGIASKIIWQLRLVSALVCPSKIIWQLRLVSALVCRTKKDGEEFAPNYLHHIVCGNHEIYVETKLSPESFTLNLCPFTFNIHHQH